jgi:hypothetical protein
MHVDLGFGFLGNRSRQTSGEYRLQPCRTVKYYTVELW